MEEPLTHRHLHHHAKKIKLFILLVIVILAAGEYYLYRQQLHLNKMVSEGIFQLKQQIDTNNQQQLMKIEEMTNPSPTSSPKK